MDKERQKLLESLLAKMGQAIKDMHHLGTLPFGSLRLSRPQFVILLYIAPKKGGATVKELAKFMQITPGAITQFVNVLVTEKLVSRQSASPDRRIISLKLTEKAKRQFGRFKAEYFKKISTSFARLSTPEIAQFIRLIEKIDHSIDKNI